MNRKWLTVFLLAALGCALGAGWSGASDQVFEDMSFVQADIRDVFRTLGTYGGYNVLLTSEVRATVDLAFQQRMTIKEAIELIARSNQYDIRWVNDRTVVIGSADVLVRNFDAKSSKVFTLYYATVDEIAEALRVVVESNQISRNPRTNQVTIHGSILELQNAQEIINQMDHPMPQVTIQARMEEVSENAIEELGFSWDTNVSYGFGSNLTVVPMDTITATLKALEDQNKAVLLAEPNAAVLDSQSANIFIGERYPVTFVTTDESGNLKYVVQYVEIGTKLTVSARVNLNDIVTTTVQAEVSNISGEVESQGGKMPIIRSRTTKSMVRLRDGQTFVMTGLIQRDQSTHKTGIPILDKVPLLGVLFSNTRNTDKSTVICVFLTIRVMKVQSDEIPTAETRSAWENKSAKPPQTSTGEGVAPGPAAGGAPETESTAVAPSSAASQSEAAAGQPENGAGSATSPDAGMRPGTEPGEESISAEEMAERADPAIAAVPADVPTEPVFGAPGIGSDPLAETPDADAGESSPPPLLVEPIPEMVPPVTAAPSTPSTPRPEEIRHLSYQVKKGDTLASIGRKFGVPWPEIAAYNNLDRNAILRPGQRIMVPIPDSHKYVVKPKETLWRIAKRYGTTVELLMEINGITDPAKIEIGQVIVLPCPVSRVANPEY